MESMVTRKCSAGGCGRPVHDAPDGTDKIPVCLMHSNDPNKRSGQLFEDFRRCIEETIAIAEAGIPYGSSVGIGDENLDSLPREAVNNIADFGGFVFPDMPLGRKIRCRCQFRNAKFSGPASFQYVEFGGGVDFSHAVFEKRTRFYKSVFLGKATFANAIFEEFAEFSEVIFSDVTDFLNTIFRKSVYFDKATFKRKTFFMRAEFFEYANFSGAAFDLGATLNEVKFDNDVSFFNCGCLENASFVGTIFSREANFTKATFKASANFMSATFEGEVDFTETNIRTAQLENCKFLEGAVFRRSLFERVSPNIASAIFERTRFASPGDVVFDDLDVSKFSFPTAI